MLASTASERFAALPKGRKEPIDSYNFEHFCMKHLLKDGQRTIQYWGVPPGEVAPDFELPRADDGSLRLSDLRGRPVLLHFGSIS